jgi:hypothetical protein
MKLYVILAAMFGVGLLASMAVAKPPPGHGNPHGTPPGKSHVASATETESDDTGTTSTSTGTTTGRDQDHGPGHDHGRTKVTLCHHTRSKTHPWVKITVAAPAAAHREKKGDVPVADDGSCPSGASTTTGTTETTATTQTAATATTTTG